MRYVRVNNNVTNRSALKIESPTLDNRHLTFQIATYIKLSGKNVKEEAWDINFHPINNLDLGDKEHIVVGSLALINKKIEEQAASNQLVTDIIPEIGRIIVEMDLASDLHSKIKTVADQLPLGNFDGIGSRAQDKKELTFKREDVVELMTLVLFCKLLSPVFGSIMFHMINQGTETKTKESKVIDIVKPILSTRFNYIYHRLQTYIKHTAKNFKEDMTSIYHGVTNITIRDTILANLLIRNFINIDVYKEDGNLMTFVSVIIKKTIDAQQNVMGNDKFMTRKDMSGDLEDANRAQIEVDSISSKRTADDRIIVEGYSQNLCESLIGHFGLSRTEYNRMLKLSAKRPIPVHKANFFITSNIFSKYLGGGRSPKLLGSKYMSSLLIFTRMLAESLGLNEVARLMTATPTDNVISEQSRITLAWKSSPNYKQLRNNLPKNVVKMLDDEITEIVNSLSTYVFVDWTDGFKIEVDSIVDEICALIQVEI